MKKFSTVVIFGGSGYIAGYTVNYLIEHDLSDLIVLVDIKQPRIEVWTDKVTKAFSDGQVKYIAGDVREAIQLDLDSVDLIVNYAAIHREPGHEAYEYFETNIKGAENVVTFAESVGCETIVFTSSIAPYGHANVARTEKSQVVPYSPYGSSKLTAEKIHEGWQRAASSQRKLMIVRPGVIFGPHEDGNVPRLRGALKKGLFCYVGNKEVRKSGGYVKELVNTVFWVYNWMEEHQQQTVLYNFSLPQPPTLEEYVETIQKVAGIKRWVPTLPFRLLLGISHVIQAVSTLVGINQPVHPDRIKKLKVDNMIIPEFLVDNGYPFLYDLESCLSDWKKDVPDEW